jgi:hypothetical protein
MDTKMNKQTILDLYMTYWNDFISVGAFADWVGVDDDKALQIIRIGRKLNKRLGGK